MKKEIGLWFINWNSSTITLTRKQRLQLSFSGRYAQFYSPRLLISTTAIIEDERITGAVDSVDT